ncbi:unnamed protein product [Lampetra planeri]
MAAADCWDCAQRRHSAPFPGGQQPCTERRTVHGCGPAIERPRRHRVTGTSRPPCAQRTTPPSPGYGFSAAGDANGNAHGSSSSGGGRQRKGMRAGRQRAPIVVLLHSLTGNRSTGGSLTWQQARALGTHWARSGG